MPGFLILPIKTMNVYRLTALPSVLLALIPLSGCNAEASTATLRFSAIPNENATLLRQKYDPVAEYLSEKLGVAVEYIPAADYQASVAMFINGEIQMAWFGGFTGVQARNKVEGARAIVKGEKDAHYKSYFIVSRDSELTKSDEFPMAAAGKRFAFGSQSSTSGRLMPEFFIRQATGKTSDEFFGEVSYSGSHDNTITNVKDGNWDIGVVDFGVYDGRIADGSLTADECPVIWETPSYADYQFTIRPDLDASLGMGIEQELAAALLEMPPELAQAFRRDKMVPAANEDFAGILDVALKLKMIK